MMAQAAGATESRRPMIFLRRPNTQRNLLRACISRGFGRSGGSPPPATLVRAGSENHASPCNTCRYLQAECPCRDGPALTSKCTMRRGAQRFAHARLLLLHHAAHQAGHGVHQRQAQQQPQHSGPHHILCVPSQTSLRSTQPCVVKSVPGVPWAPQRLPTCRVCIHAAGLAGRASERTDCSDCRLGRCKVQEHAPRVQSSACSKRRTSLTRLACTHHRLAPPRT